MSPLIQPGSDGFAADSEEQLAKSTVCATVFLAARVHPDVVPFELRSKMSIAKHFASGENMRLE